MDKLVEVHISYSISSHRLITLYIYIELENLLIINNNGCETHCSMGQQRGEIRSWKFDGRSPSRN